MRSVTELGSNCRKALMTSEVGTSQDAGLSLGAYSGLGLSMGA